MSSERKVKEKNTPTLPSENASQCQLLEDTMDVFRCHANPENAQPMAAYMKHQFPFLGIKKPERKTLERALLQQLKKDKTIESEIIERLWSAKEREFQYLALDLLVAVQSELKPDVMPLLERLIHDKSWWDTVDLIAAQLVGPMTLRTPELIDAYIRPWSISDNLWLRRTAILFQLKSKKATDTGLLEDIIIENCGTKEFFLNKAIGWALREYSKTDPDWVAAFLCAHELAPLSVREAGKYLK
ncbi:DNA alkylation repair protein [Acidaminobacter hydrogenoformans]|uniref:3-methyladenine DNA glycosylase AlkD n=1 Tax=Acidaminobacter hydrogenoformans DSM 2784 TaxID=1120920 RepID=A0A1G5S5D8_9FIRM|nr:DNA alkylation repair protein [Acidaminobacter hydrogenoformans]SCZ81555.1 3-methyladenine DNA glycosylase AlkD [Acidaminobacter hydrogenoformans DSM 2784]